MIIFVLSKIQMRLAEINRKLSQMTTEVNAIKSQLSKINSDYSQLKLLRHQTEIGHFRNWLHADQLIDITGYMFLSGVETTKNLSAGVRSKQPHFRQDEQIQVLKINEKSVVIKCIKGLLKDRTFRVEIEMFHQYLMSELEVNRQFHKWLIRTESLGELEITN